MIGGAKESPAHWFGRLCECSRSSKNEIPDLVLISLFVSMRIKISYRPRWHGDSHRLGGGNPQRIIAISRTLSDPVLTTGAIWSGKTAGSGRIIIWEGASLWI